MIDIILNNHSNYDFSSNNVELVERFQAKIKTLKIMYLHHHINQIILFCKLDLILATQAACIGYVYLKLTLIILCSLSVIIVHKNLVKYENLQTLLFIFCKLLDLSFKTLCLYYIVALLLCCLHNFIRKNNIGIINHNIVLT